MALIINKDLVGGMPMTGKNTKVTKVDKADKVLETPTVKSAYFTEDINLKENFLEVPVDSETASPPNPLDRGFIKLNNNIKDWLSENPTVKIVQMSDFTITVDNDIRLVCHILYI